MSEKAIFETEKPKSLNTEQFKRTFSTSQHGTVPVRIVPRDTVLSVLDKSVSARETQKKFSIVDELKKNPALADSTLLQKDDGGDGQRRRKNHDSEDDDDSEVDEHGKRKVNPFVAHTRLPTEDKFANPLIKETGADASTKEKAVRDSVNRSNSALKEKKKKKLAATAMAWEEKDEESDSESAISQEKEMDDETVFYTKKRKLPAEGVKRLVKEKPARVEEKKKEAEKYNLEDGYVSEDRSDAKSDEDGHDSDNSMELLEEEEQYEQEDEFGEMREIDDCRACKEAFGTGKNRDRIDEFIDHVLASTNNSLSLDCIIGIIYKHVEIQRRRHNDRVTDAREHIDVWPRHMIKKHLLEHMVRLDMQIKAQHEFNKRTERLILQQIKAVDPENGSVVLNYKAIEALLKVQKAIKDNTRMNPESSYSYVSEQAPKRTRIKRAIDGAGDL